MDDFIKKCNEIMHGKEKKKLMEGLGFQVMRSNFYSIIPTVDEIETGWERNMDNPFFDSDLYDNDSMKEFLSKKLMPYAREFAPKNDGNMDEPEGYFWNNGVYGFSDALSLYCMIRYVKPKRIMEIGGGFSTLIIDMALKKNGFGEIIEIEPFPRKFMKKISSITEFHEKPIQEMPLSLFEKLEKGDILFIDSTHTVKESSDCTYIYLKALKKVQSGVYIHIHDIFLPEPYPKAWHYDHGIYWNEQYVLQALICDTATYEIIYGSNYHKLFNKGLLDEFMDSKIASGGGSFWMIKKDRKK